MDDGALALTGATVQRLKPRWSGLWSHTQVPIREVVNALARWPERCAHSAVGLE